MFHTIAGLCADLLIGKAGKHTRKHARRQAFRALEHNFCSSQCQNKKVLGKFPAEVLDFATLFATMQIKRHSADYDPTSKFYKSEVSTDLEAVRIATEKLLHCTRKDLVAFCSWVMFKARS